MSFIKKDIKVSLLLLIVFIVIIYTGTGIAKIIEIGNKNNHSIIVESSIDNISTREGKELLLNHISNKIGISKEMFIVNDYEIVYINGEKSNTFEVREKLDVGMPVIGYYCVTDKGEIYYWPVITDDIYKLSK